MMDIRPVIFVVGVLLATLAVVMCVPAVVDYSLNHSDWEVFAVAAGVTFFVGVTMALIAARESCHGAPLVIDETCSWVRFCASRVARRKMPTACCGLRSESPK